jgi:hypothetical protein
LHAFVVSDSIMHPQSSQMRHKYSFTATFEQHGKVSGGGEGHTETTPTIGKALDLRLTMRAMVFSRQEVHSVDDTDHRMRGVCREADWSGQTLGPHPIR